MSRRLLFNGYILSRNLEFSVYKIAENQRV